MSAAEGIEASALRFKAQRLAAELSVSATHNYFIITSYGRARWRHRAFVIPWNSSRTRYSAGKSKNYFSFLPSNIETKQSSYTYAD